LKYTVLGDGITEQYYLKYLKEIKGYNYSIRPSLFERIELTDARKIIDELLESGSDGIVYITDYDTVVNQNRKREFNSLKARFKDNSNVLICESMPSIEFWFLLHFKASGRIFQNADEVLKALKQHIPDFEKTKRWLGNKLWVKQLCSDDKLETAISRAKSIEKERTKGNFDSHNPFSLVYLGIEEFEKWKNSFKP